MDVQYLLGHSTPDVVRRRSATYYGDPHLTSAHRRVMNDIGWPSLPSGSGLASLAIAPGKQDPPEASFHPVLTPVSPPTFESEALAIRPNQGSSQAEGHGFDPHRPLQI